MATVTISIAGSGIVANSSKTYTISDADLQTLLNWGQATFFASGATPTNQQILLAWIQNFISTTTDAVQIHGTKAPLPPPIIFS